MNYMLVHHCTALMPKLDGLDHTKVVLRSGTLLPKSRVLRVYN